MSKINPLIFIKTKKEKETLKEIKKQINSELRSQFGTKRIGNKQFAIKQKLVLQ